MHFVNIVATDSPKYPNKSSPNNSSHDTMRTRVAARVAAVVFQSVEIGIPRSQNRLLHL
jgi:hypothetical protein